MIAPAISCVSEDDALIFTWNIVVNADSYGVDVTSGNTGMLVNDSTFVVSPVAAGESVSIELTVSSSNTCAEVISSASCSQLDCPSIELIPANQELNVCIENNGTTLLDLSDIEVLVDGVTAIDDFTLSFSGSDAVISQTGEFDPVIAGVGVTVITVNYFDPQNCQASIEIIINVGEVITPVILSD